MTIGRFDFAFAIGGAAGQGIATPGNVLALLFVRRGLHLYAYNAVGEPMVTDSEVLQEIPPSLHDDRAQGGD